MEYDPSETVALLSALVFQDKTDHEPSMTPMLEQGCQQMTKIAERVEAVCLRHKVSADDNDSPRSSRTGLNFGMVEIVWHWAQGMVIPVYLIFPQTCSLKTNIDLCVCVCFYPVRYSAFCGSSRVE